MKAKIEVKEIVVGLANGKELRLPLEEAVQLREALNRLMEATRPLTPHWTPYWQPVVSNIPAVTYANSLDTAEENPK